MCILTCKKDRSSTSVSGAGYNRYRSNSLFLRIPIRKWFLCKTLDQLFIFYPLLAKVQFWGHSPLKSDTIYGPSLIFLCNFLFSKIKRPNYQDLCILTCKKGRSSTSVSGAGYNRYRSNSLFLRIPIRKWFLCKTLDQLFIFSTTSSIFVSLNSFISSWQVAIKVVMVMAFTLSGQLSHFQSLA